MEQRTMDHQISKMRRLAAFFKASCLFYLKIKIIKFLEKNYQKNIKKEFDKFQKFTQNSKI